MSLNVMIHCSVLYQTEMEKLNRNQSEKKKFNFYLRIEDSNQVQHCRGFKLTDANRNLPCCVKFCNLKNACVIYFACNSGFDRTDTSLQL